MDGFMTANVFFCYAGNDQEFLKELKKHLMPLLRNDTIRIWDDQDILAGSEWKKEIEEKLSSSHIILLLISSDFMASDYCYSVEMKRAIDLHEHGKACVIPIILRPVFWKNSPFARLWALPTNGVPIVDGSWHSQDEAFKNVVEGIKKVIDERFPSEDAGKHDAGISGSNSLEDRRTFVQYKLKNTLKSKIHGCDVHFTLSKDHFLQYTFEWEPLNLFSPGSRFMLWLDGVNLVDRGKVDMSYIDVQFAVEDKEGMILCHHKDKNITVLIKVADRILFEKRDTWNSKI